MGELLRRTISSTAASVDAESNDLMTLPTRGAPTHAFSISMDSMSPTGTRKDIVGRSSHSATGSSRNGAASDEDDDEYYNGHSSTAPAPAGVVNDTTTAAASTTIHLSKVTIVMAGQCLSFLLACSGAAQASLHLDCHLTAPTFAVGLFYCGLSLACLIPLYLKQRRMEQIILASSSLSSLDPTILGGKLMIHAGRSPQGAYVRAVSSCNSSLDDGDMILRTIATNNYLDESDASRNGHDSHRRHPAVTRSDLRDDEDDEPHPMVQDTNNSMDAKSSTNPHHPHKESYPQPHQHYYKFACFRRLHAPWYAYAGMAVLDVYANYVTVLAFRYTTITSVTLLDALSIPTAMLLSRLILQSRYTRTHLIGVTLCLTGIVINVLQDLHHDQNNSSNNNNGGSNSSGRENGSTREDDEYPYKVYGDMLSMMGGILFGANKVLGEIAVKNSHDPDEYIGMQSLFAVIICIVQTVLTEMNDIASFFGRGGNETCSVSTARWLLLGFVVSNMIGYLGTARFLMHSEAAFFNLSLLTGDFWSAAFQIVAEHIWPASTFYLAAVLTLSGVLMYELASPEISVTTATTTVSIETFANGVDDDDEEDRNTMTLELAPTKNHGTRARNGIAGIQDAVPIPIV